MPGIPTVSAPAGPLAFGAAAAAARLRREVRGAVSDDRRRRAEYSSDAGNYRVVPSIVVEPLDLDDVLATLAVSRELRIPLTSRGGGTSIAGNAIGSGIVIDFARHLNTVLELDPGSRTALVEPGVVLTDLQRAARPHGLRFGPDPSSQSRATLGGMIGNNACGAHAVAYGRTADNVVSMTVISGGGQRFSTAAGSVAMPGLDRLIDDRLAVIRTEFGRFGRQISGYSLEHLLPERGRDLTRALVGSEGTLVTVLDATVRLVPIRPARLLLVLGYPDMPAAADAVPALLRHQPEALEGLDSRLVDVVRRGGGVVPELPRGAGWLMIEVGGDTEAQARSTAAAMIRDGAASDALILPSGPQATAMWRIREDGSGLAGRTADNRPAWPGWEDAAVPPANLGGYLRAFDTLMATHGVVGVPYGHFGDGCVHVRIDLPLGDREPLRQFLFDAARLVVEHGGSCSGEHGDGRARSELLPLMYSDAAIALFGGVKNLFDPQDLLNPGVLVRPNPLDDDLRRPSALPLRAAGGFAFLSDGGDLTGAVHRCVGIGKCRADNSEAGGFMCPSFLATRDEKDVTRGRARVLQELTNGTLIGDWSAPEVEESLDLCLSCKACASDCPAGVDMARYKSEALFRRYAGRRRPWSHHTLGRLPRWTRMIGGVPGAARLANAVLRVRALERLVLRLGGMDPRRHAPRLAPGTFRRSFRPAPGHEPPVLLWVDSFTDGFQPAVAQAAVAVLAAAGYRAVLPERAACCGLTWITTGQLDGARSRLRRLLDLLHPHVAAGTPLIGLEPSCVAAIRSDLLELLPDDPRAAAVAAATRTLAEFLTDAAWTAPDLTETQILAQPHCHQHAVMGYRTDEALLAAAGAQTTLVAGCCGLAGNFGMERGHYEVSVAVAENALLPALRARSADTVVLADGFSCRTQIGQLAGVRAVTLAELLASRLAAGPRS